ncbi:MAG: hypothetical protein SFZ24_05975 [Planctomycetota bacterium]|nr:hypothetical protein [Planctomycetota bacterium]
MECSARRALMVGVSVLALSGGAVAQSSSRERETDANPSSGTPRAAAAAAPKEMRPPAPVEPPKPNVIVPFLLMFVFIGATVGLAVLPSKRTHQD